MRKNRLEIEKNRVAPSEDGTLKGYGRGRGSLWAWSAIIVAMLSSSLLSLLLASCANMGAPDGGWYDETPPRVVGASPADNATNVTAKKIVINFDEYIKIDNPTENVIVSPPQIEAPEIKAAGKSIVVELKDTLKPNTTYTVDFSDAISDNNEGNPMGSYTYSFSTGESIDTMEVSGYVLNAQDLEPIKGICVGLYSDLSDSIVHKQPMVRISRTDSRGHFVIKGVAPGQYRAFALQDADGNFVYNQKSEVIGFSPTVFNTSAKPDVRQDTIWADSLHIRDIKRVNYTHFYPDDIVLRAFAAPMTDRYLLKSERRDERHIDLFFSYGGTELPQIRGLNFNEQGAFDLEASVKGDTLMYWLRDTALVNQDSLNIEVKYMMTDSLGALQLHTDTLQMLAKESYAKRMKDRQKEYDTWQKKQEKNKKKGLAYDSIMPPKALEVKIGGASALDPDKNIAFDFPTPLATVDTSKIHLYAQHDSVWYASPCLFVQRRDSTVTPINAIYGSNRRMYELRGEWRPDIEYSMECDSAAFVDIYGLASKPIKQGFKVKSLDEYSTILFNIQGLEGQQLIMQLLDAQDNVAKQAKVVNSTAEFFYVEPKTYYARLIVDANGNGRWDTGDYDQQLAPEQVFYYPEKIECKAKWDVTQSWSPDTGRLWEQKPSAILKQKSEKKQIIKNRNAERARQKGIPYVQQNMPAGH